MNGSSEMQDKCWNTSKTYFWVQCLDWDDILGAESSSSFGGDLFVNPSSEEWNICVNSVQSLLDMVEVRSIQFVQVWSLIGTVGKSTSCIQYNSHQRVREAVNKEMFLFCLDIVRWWKMAFFAHFELAFGCLRAIMIAIWTIIGTLLLHLLKIIYMTSGTPANVSVDASRPHICHFFSSQIFSTQIFLHTNSEQKRHKFR